jgi:hypothetical protein
LRKRIPLRCRIDARPRPCRDQSGRGSRGVRATVPHVASTSCSRVTAQVLPHHDAAPQSGIPASTYPKHMRRRYARPLFGRRCTRPNIDHVSTNFAQTKRGVPAGRLIRRTVHQWWRRATRTMDIVARHGAQSAGHDLRCTPTQLRSVGQAEGCPQARPRDRGR